MLNVDGVNVASRARAEARGQPTYRHHVIDTWTGCTTCGHPIRWNVDMSLPGLWRACSCDGVVWRNNVTGEAWERWTMDAVERQAREREEARRAIVAGEWRP